MKEKHSRACVEHLHVRRSDTFSLEGFDAGSVTGVSRFCGQDDSGDAFAGDADLSTVRSCSSAGVERSSRAATGHFGLLTRL